MHDLGVVQAVVERHQHGDDIVVVLDRTLGDVFVIWHDAVQHEASGGRTS